MYKLRIYNERGSVDHEEIFESCEEMIQRYKELFVKYSAVNPTAWVNLDVPLGWMRLPGF